MLRFIIGKSIFLNMKKFVLPLFILLIHSIWAQIPSYVPVYGLLSYYPFNGNGNDASVNANHLTNYGAVPTTDRFNNANAAGCDSLVILNLTLDFTGIEENASLNWKLYPNPASVSALIEVNEGLLGTAIVFYDAFGKEILRNIAYSQGTIIDLQQLPTGIYFVRVGSEIQRLEVVR
jgi:hypothetical protein